MTKNYNGTYWPLPNQRIIKRHERKVGKAIEAVSSDESCEKALSLEKARSKTDADHATGHFKTI